MYSLYCLDHTGELMDRLMLDALPCHKPTELKMDLKGDCVDKITYVRVPMKCMIKAPQGMLFITYKVCFKQSV